MSSGGRDGPDGTGGGDDVHYATQHIDICSKSHANAVGNANANATAMLASPTSIPPLIPDDAGLDAIEAARQALGFSASELCRRADLNESHYNKLRRGDYAPTGRTLRKLRLGLRKLAEEVA